MNYPYWLKVLIELFSSNKTKGVSKDVG
jgi:hypothetical protein